MGVIAVCGRRVGSGEGVGREWGGSGQGVGREWAGGGQEEDKLPESIGEGGREWGATG